MYKNITVRQITIYITLVVSLINVMIFIPLILSGRLDIHLITILLVIFAQIIFAYFIVKTFLERFVFRKIKLIYKFIYESKLGSSTKNTFDFDETSIDDVNMEVIEWGKKKEKEIETLKTLEAYRKNYVGNISHELKTPIFSIQGYLHTLLEGGIHDQSINMKYLDRAAQNAERLQNIVEDLEVISRLEGGNVILDLRSFDIKQLVEEVFSDLEVLAAEKNIKLQFKDGANQPFHVMADRESIRQVLNNLIVNSIKYGNINGYTKVSFYDVEQNVLIEVSDNGIGISDDHLKHVFDRFYRVDTSRSRSQGGSGLGLSIVKHIIEAHNQTINVRSTPGIGSTFGFTLKKNA